MAYWGFEGGVGAMLRDASVRKAGGERPKAEGEKPVGRLRWCSDRSPVWREKMDGRGDC